MLYNGYNNYGYQSFVPQPNQMQQIQQPTASQYNLNGKIVLKKNLADICALLNRLGSPLIIVIFSNDIKNNAIIS